MALKFELAYLRDLDIGNPKRDDVERITRSTADLPNRRLKNTSRLEDYLFRYISHEAERLNLAIHMHTSEGVGSYLKAANANPLAMEPLFNDPTFRKTKFVMLHGAWPFTREAGMLILKPNVYLDYSAWSYMTYPHQAAIDLRFLWKPRRSTFSTVRCNRLTCTTPRQIHDNLQPTKAGRRLFNAVPYVVFADDVAFHEHRSRRASNPPFSNRGPRSASTSAIATRAPSAANRRTVASPIPDARR